MGFVNILGREVLEIGLDETDKNLPNLRLLPGVNGGPSFVQYRDRFYRNAAISNQTVILVGTNEEVHHMIEDRGDSPKLAGESLHPIIGNPYRWVRRMLWVPMSRWGHHVAPWDKKSTDLLVVHTDAVCFEDMAIPSYWNGDSAYEDCLAACHDLVTFQDELRARDVTIWTIVFGTSEDGASAVRTAWENEDCIGVLDDDKWMEWVEKLNDKGKVGDLFNTCHTGRGEMIKGFSRMAAKRCWDVLSEENIHPIVKSRIEAISLKIANPPTVPPVAVTAVSEVVIETAPNPPSGESDLHHVVATKVLPHRKPGGSPRIWVMEDVADKECRLSCEGQFCVGGTPFQVSEFLREHADDSGMDVIWFATNHQGFQMPDGTYPFSRSQDDICQILVDRNRLSIRLLFISTVLSHVKGWKTDPPQWKIEEFDAVATRMDDELGTASVMLTSLKDGSQISGEYPLQKIINAGIECGEKCRVTTYSLGNHSRLVFSAIPEEDAAVETPVEPTPAVFGKMGEWVSYNSPEAPKTSKATFWLCVYDKESRLWDVWKDGKQEHDLRDAYHTDDSFRRYFLSRYADPGDLFLRCTDLGICKLVLNRFEGVQNGRLMHHVVCTPTRSATGATYFMRGFVPGANITDDEWESVKRSCQKVSEAIASKRKSTEKQPVSCWVRTTSLSIWELWKDGEKVHTGPDYNGETWESYIGLHAKEGDLIHDLFFYKELEIAKVSLVPHPVYAGYNLALATQVTQVPEASVWSGEQPSDSPLSPEEWAAFRNSFVKVDAGFKASQVPTDDKGTETSETVAVVQEVAAETPKRQPTCWFVFEPAPRQYVLYRNSEMVHSGTMEECRNKIQTEAEAGDIRYWHTANSKNVFLYRTTESKERNYKQISQLKFSDILAGEGGKLGLTDEEWEVFQPLFIALEGQLTAEVVQGASAGAQDHPSLTCFFAVEDGDVYRLYRDEEFLGNGDYNFCIDEANRLASPGNLRCWISGHPDDLNVYRILDGKNSELVIIHQIPHRKLPDEKIRGFSQAEWEVFRPLFEKVVTNGGNPPDDKRTQEEMSAPLVTTSNKTSTPEMGGSPDLEEKTPTFFFAFQNKDVYTYSLYRNEEYISKGNYHFCLKESNKLAKAGDIRCWIDTSEDFEVYLIANPTTGESSLISHKRVPNLQFGDDRLPHISQTLWDVFRPIFEKIVAPKSSTSLNAEARQTSQDQEAPAPACFIGIGHRDGTYVIYHGESKIATGTRPACHTACSDFEKEGDIRCWVEDGMCDEVYRISSKGISLPVKDIDLYVPGTKELVTERPGSLSQAEWDVLRPLFLKLVTSPSTEPDPTSTPDEPESTIQASADVVPFAEDKRQPTCFFTIEQKDGWSYTLYQGTQYLLSNTRGKVAEKLVAINQDGDLCCYFDRERVLLGVPFLGHKVEYFDIFNGNRDGDKEISCEKPTSLPQEQWDIFVPLFVGILRIGEKPHLHWTNGEKRWTKFHDMFLETHGKLHVESEVVQTTSDTPEPRFTCFVGIQQEGKERINKLYRGEELVMTAPHQDCLHEAIKLSRPGDIRCWKEYDRGHYSVYRVTKDYGSYMGYAHPSKQNTISQDQLSPEEWEIIRTLLAKLESEGNTDPNPPSALDDNPTEVRDDNPLGMEVDYESSRGETPSIVDCFATPADETVVETVTNEPSAPKPTINYFFGIKQSIEKWNAYHGDRFLCEGSYDFCLLGMKQSSKPGDLHCWSGGGYYYSVHRVYPDGSLRRRCGVHPHTESPAGITQEEWDTIRSFIVKANSGRLTPTSTPTPTQDPETNGDLVMANDTAVAANSITENVATVLETQPTVWCMMVEGSGIILSRENEKIASPNQSYCNLDYLYSHAKDGDVLCCNNGSKASTAKDSFMNFYRLQGDPGQVFYDSRKALTGLKAGDVIDDEFEEIPFGLTAGQWDACRRGVIHLINFSEKGDPKPVSEPVQVAQKPVCWTFGYGSSFDEVYLFLNGVKVEELPATSEACHAYFREHASDGDVMCVFNTVTPVRFLNADVSCFGVVRTGTEPADYQDMSVPRGHCRLVTVLEQTGEPKWGFTQAQWHTIRTSFLAMPTVLDYLVQRCLSEEQSATPEVVQPTQPEVVETKKPVLWLYLYGKGGRDDVLYRDGEKIATDHSNRHFQANANEGDVLCTITIATTLLDSRVSYGVVSRPPGSVARSWEKGYASGSMRLHEIISDDHAKSAGGFTQAQWDMVRAGVLAIPELNKNSTSAELVPVATDQPTKPTYWGVILGNGRLTLWREEEVVSQLTTADWACASEQIIKSGRVGDFVFSGYESEPSTPFSLYRVSTQSIGLDIKMVCTFAASNARRAFEGQVSSDPADKSRFEDLVTKWTSHVVPEKSVPISDKQPVPSPYWVVVGATGLLDLSLWHEGKLIMSGSWTQLRGHYRTNRCGAGVLFSVSLSSGGDVLSEVAYINDEMEYVGSTDHKGTYQKHISSNPADWERHRKLIRDCSEGHAKVVFDTEVTRGVVRQERPQGEVEVTQVVAEESAADPTQPIIFWGVVGGPGSSNLTLWRGGYRVMEGDWTTLDAYFVQHRQGPSVLCGISVDASGVFGKLEEAEFRRTISTDPSQWAIYQAMVEGWIKYETDPEFRSQIKGTETPETTPETTEVISEEPIASVPANPEEKPVYWGAERKERWGFSLWREGEFLFEGITFAEITDYIAEHGHQRDIVFKFGPEDRKEDASVYRLNGAPNSTVGRVCLSTIGEFYGESQFGLIFSDPADWVRYQSLRSACDQGKSVFWGISQVESSPGDDSEGKKKRIYFIWREDSLASQCDSWGACTEYLRSHVAKSDHIFALKDNGDYSYFYRLSPTFLTPTITAVSNHACLTPELFSTYVSRDFRDWKSLNQLRDVWKAGCEEWTALAKAEAERNEKTVIADPKPLDTQAESEPVQIDYAQGERFDSTETLRQILELLDRMGTEQASLGGRMAELEKRVGDLPKPQAPEIKDIKPVEGKDEQPRSTDVRLVFVEGDKAQVKKNVICDPVYGPRHPWGHRELRSGDIIEIFDVRGEGVITYLSGGKVQTFPLHHLVPAPKEAKSPSKTPHVHWVGMTTDEEDVDCKGVIKSLTETVYGDTLGDAFMKLKDRAKPEDTYAHRDYTDLVIPLRSVVKGANSIGTLTPLDSLDKDVQEMVKYTRAKLLS